MVSPSSHPQGRGLEELNIIIDFLQQAGGSEFAVLSPTSTLDAQQKEGQLSSKSTGETVKVIHCTNRPDVFSKDVFLSDRKIQEIIFEAFITGQLGIKTAESRYAFSKEQCVKLHQSGAELMHAKNASLEDQIDLEALLDTIPEDLYTQLLEQLKLITPDSEDKETDLDEVEGSLTHSTLDSVKSKTAVNRNSQKKSNSPVLRSPPKEAIHDKERIEARERVKNAAKKDQLAQEKLRGYISLNLLKAEIKKSALLQALIIKGEVDELDLFKKLENAEVSETAMNILLELAEVNEALFANILQNEEINDTLINAKIG